MLKTPQELDSELLISIDQILLISKVLLEDVGPADMIPSTFRKLLKNAAYRLSKYSEHYSTEYTFSDLSDSILCNNK